MAEHPIIHACTETLEGYAQRGFLQGFSPLNLKGKQAQYRLLWHFNRVYELNISLTSGKIQMPVVLPNVPLRSAMDRDFRGFIQEFYDADRPEHRRFSAESLSVTNRQNNLSLSLQLSDRDNPIEVVAELGRFIALVHEVYKIFLKNGLYDQYVSEQFGIDADAFW